MISAEFKLDMIYPPDNIGRDRDPIVDPSLRVVSCIVGESAVLKPFPPFIVLQLDVEDRRDPHLRSLLTSEIVAVIRAYGNVC